MPGYHGTTNENAVRTVYRRRDRESNLSKCGVRRSTCPARLRWNFGSRTSQFFPPSGEIGASWLKRPSNVGFIENRHRLQIDGYPRMPAAKSEPVWQDACLLQQSLK